MQRIWQLMRGRGSNGNHKEFAGARVAEKENAWITPPIRKRRSNPNTADMQRLMNYTPNGR